jgi:seryl-tRNA(Sec) selenium transferase
LSGYEIQSTQGGVIILTAQLEIDSWKLESDYRPKTLNTFVKSDQSFIDMFSVSGQELCALQVELRVRRLRDSASKVVNRSRSKSEFGKHACSCHYSFKVIRLLNEETIEHELRTYSPPIIARISEGKVLLDLRTVFADQLPAIRAALATITK